MSDPVFRRSKFLLRQKHPAFSEEYDVWDESGNPLLFIVRPLSLIRNFLAALLTVLLLAVALGGCLALGLALPGGSIVRVPLMILTVAGGVLGAVLAGVACYAPRHAYVYRDDSRRERLLTIEQDRAWTVFSASYTVKDVDGTVLARLRKNYFYNCFRRRWTCEAPDGTLLSVIKEDTLLFSLMRRYVGSFFGLLRTNFVFLKGAAEEDVIGELNRGFTILDRYVLDLTADEEGHLDRRVALAAGVLLDTGERR